MGYGEYGGNGSVHWYGSHTRDRNHGHSHHDYHEVDEEPQDGGDFIVQVFNVEQAHGVYDAHNRTWTITVPILHGREYTEQARVTWPPDRAKQAV